jgi:TPR repeat protein
MKPLKQYFFVCILILACPLVAEAMVPEDKDIARYSRRRNTYEALIKDLERLKGVTAYSLGVMCWEGRGGKRNEKEAFEFFLEAARQGHTKAQYTVGVMYAKGSGVEKNKKQAIEWLQKAADSKLKVAIDTLKVVKK